MTIQINMASRVSRDTRILCMISLVALLLTYTDFVIENKAIEGFISQLPVRTMYYDVFPLYPDLLVFQFYGTHDKFENTIT